MVDLNLDPKDYELKIFFLDEDGEMLPTNVAIVPLDDFLHKPFLWSFEPERVCGVCLRLRGGTIVSDEGKNGESTNS